MSNDDHPHADIRAGEHFMHSIYTSVTTSPALDRTVLIFNFDEWGGFFDHVPPPVGAISPIDIAAGYTDGRLGFRTPLLVVSPFAQANYVAHEVYDHTSILRMVETRWGLPPLAARDATVNNLADLLDFDAPARTPPAYPVPPVTIGAAGPVTTPTTPTVGTDRASASVVAGRRVHWDGLAALAAAHGFPRGVETLVR